MVSPNENGSVGVLVTETTATLSEVVGVPRVTRLAVDNTASVDTVTGGGAVIEGSSLSSTVTV